MLDYGEYSTVADYPQGNGNGYDQLEGDWALFYKVARYFVHKVKFEDREDFLHDLMLEMAKVKAKYEAKGKPLTEAGLMRVASYELSEYWVKQRRLTTWLDCGNCSKEQRRKCREEDLYSPAVALKARAAQAWCESASGIPSPEDLPQPTQWEYLLLSEGLFKANRGLSFEGLIPLYQALRERVIAQQQGKLF